jgi:acetate kinase
MKYLSYERQIYMKKLKQQARLHRAHIGGGASAAVTFSGASTGTGEYNCKN